MTEVIDMPRLFRFSSACHVTRYMMAVRPQFSWTLSGEDQVSGSIMASLRVANIPSYINEVEFKKIWLQPGLECQNCTLAKTAGGE